MRLAVFAAILLLCAAGAQARVYKWTDAEGRVHYSASPPPDAQASEFRVAPTPPSAVPAADPAAAAPDGGADDAQTAASADRDEAIKRNCEVSRRNLELLENPAIRRFSEDGKDPVAYTDEERQARIDDARRMVAAFCEPGDNR